MKYISLNHYDLDGAVSCIFLDRVYNFKKVFGCGYGKLDFNIDKCIKYGVDNDIKGICITDWSLTLEQYKLLESNFTEVILIDHHSTSTEVYEYINKELDVKLCAGAQCAKHIRGYGNKLSYNDKELIGACNDYDNWHINNKHFTLGRELTELFFHINLWEFIERFKDGFDGFSDEENEYLIDSFIKKDETLESSILEVVDNKLIAILSDNNIINDLTLMKPDHLHYFIFYKDWNKKTWIMSCRSKSETVDIGNQLREFQEANNDVIEQSGGHSMAGAIHFKTNNLDDALDIIEPFITNF